MNTLGIDPGLSGALALLDADRKLVDLRDMPTLAVTRSRRQLDAPEVVGILEDWRVFHGEFRVYLEKSSPRPAQGAVSGFKLGVGFGVLLGAFAALRLPHELVTPQRWQRDLWGKTEAGTSKDRSREMAQRLYPHADLGKRKSQDRADALCIALWGYDQVRHP